MIVELIFSGGNHIFCAGCELFHARGCFIDEKHTELTFFIVKEM